jgi:hypothetical protein
MGDRRRGIEVAAGLMAVVVVKEPVGDDLVAVGDLEADPVALPERVGGWPDLDVVADDRVRRDRPRIGVDVVPAKRRAALLIQGPVRRFQPNLG